MGGASFEEAVADGWGQNDLWSHVAPRSFFSFQGFQQDLSVILVYVGQFSGAFECTYGSNKRACADKIVWGWISALVP